MKKITQIDQRKANNMYHKFTSTNDSQTRSWYTIAKKQKQMSIFDFFSMYILKEKCIFLFFSLFAFFRPTQQFFSPYETVTIKRERLQMLIYVHGINGH